MLQLNLLWIALLGLGLQSCGQSSFHGNSGQIAETKAAPTPPTDSASEKGTVSVPCKQQQCFVDGIFTAWTTPSDPAPFESYTITIQATLPDGTKLENTDVAGTVQGTDSFFRKIGPGDSYRQTADDFRMTLYIPGGGRQVRDVIKIEVAKLGESARLEIVF